MPTDKPIKIAVQADPWEFYTERIKNESWKAAQKKVSEWESHLQKAKDASTALLKQRKEEADREAESVRLMLERWTLEKKQEDEKVKAEFEERNKRLWQRIEGTIQQTQARRQAEAKARQDALERARKQQEEMARIAKEQREAEERRMKEEKERKEREEKERKEKAEKKLEMEKKEKLGVSASPTALEEVEKYREKLRYIHEEIQKRVAAESQLKSYCFNNKRHITRMVGQLTNSRTQILKIATDMDTLFNEAGRVNDLVRLWMLNFTAKAVVKQAETEVTVKPSTAFPLALVCVLLFSRHSEFLDILMARFVKKCIYVIPHFVDRQPGQSAEDFLKLAGYKKKDEDEWENDVQYTERMCGMLALWSAIVQTTPTECQNVYPIRHAWIWLARISNMPPRTITPALLNIFLEIAGPVLLQTYGRQVHKVIRVIVEHILPNIPPDAVSAKTRLQNYLEGFLKTGQLKGIEGRLPNP
ncbi:uncharacterized protein VTP21DRAFT_5608 [Calcarisporiella thermophila]|uniref:uncharacterized protein n=1 Tax=Calcarisporiella thermophila TaxID=911321 RepID=UPI0037443E77